MAERITFSSEDDDFLQVLFQQLKYGVYVNNPKELIRPYERATIKLVRIKPAEVLPTAKYVLRSHLVALEALDEELSNEGINIYELDGVVRMNNGNFICPPILEIWNEPPYNGIPVIVDGAHRLYLAMKKGIEVNCVVISGNISSMLPVLPLAGWDEVVEYDAVPDDKRNYHPDIPAGHEPNNYYRKGFPGSKGERKPNKSGDIAL